MEAQSNPTSSPIGRACVRRLRSIVVAVVAVAASSLAAGQACEDPKVLKFSIIPTQETIRELTLYKPVMDLLSKNTG